jgi:hypothetical protein
MDTGLAADAEEQCLAQEAQTKAMNDQQAEMEAKAKADQEAQAHLPPPPFRPLAEQSFMQYMQFMQETQNKFMQELMGQVGAGRIPEARRVRACLFGLAVAGCGWLCCCVVKLLCRKSCCYYFHCLATWLAVWL